MTNQPITIAITRLPHAKDLALPAYATQQSAGLDLLAAVVEPKTLAVGERALVPTGLSIALPEGYEAQIRPRSGLALKNGISLVNSPGTIDADYRGEVGVIVINHGAEAFTIERGMRIRQPLRPRIVQIGQGNTLEALNELQNNPNIVTVIQNSQDNRVIQTINQLDLTVSNIESFRAQQTLDNLDYQQVISLQ